MYIYRHVYPDIKEITSGLPIRPEVVIDAVSEKISYPARLHVSLTKSCCYSFLTLRFPRKSQHRLQYQINHSHQTRKMKTFGLLIAAGALTTLNVEGLTRSTTLNTTNANSELGSSAAVNAPISSLKLEVDNTPGTKLKEDSMKDDKTDEDAEDGSGSGKDEIKKNDIADTPMTPTSQKSSANAVISSIGVVSACAIMASIMM